MVYFIPILKLMVRNLSGSFFLILNLAMANLLLTNCSDKPLFIELHSASSESENSSSWDFSEATDYIYDPNKIEIFDGKARLKPVDQNHNADDFNSGTHVGTYLDSESVLPSVSTQSELDPSWTPKYDDIKLYHRLNLSGPQNTGTTSVATIGTNGTVSTGASGGSGADFVKSRLNTGMSFDGEGDYLTLTHPFTINDRNTSFTYQVWAKANSIPNPTAYVMGSRSSSWPRTGILLGASGYWAFSLGQNSGAEQNSMRSSSLATLDRWTHIVVVGDITNQKVSFYIDGVFNNSLDFPMGSIHTSAWFLGIGHASLADSHGGPWSNWFHGVIDEVAIWDSALTDAEILTIYQRQSAIFSEDTELSQSWTPHWDNLVGYWKMDGNWQDSSGNGNHGTASGDATFGLEAKVGSQSGIFDGEDDRIDLGGGTLFDTSKPATIMFWGKHEGDYAGTDRYPGVIQLKTDLTRGFSIIYSNSYQGLLVGSNADDGMANWMPTNDLTSTLQSQWNHIAITFDGSDYTDINSYKLYVNALEESISVAVPYSSTVHNINQIGQWSSYVTSSFNGNIDDAAVWNTQLESRDISEIYNRQKQKYAAHYDSPIIDLGTSGSWTSLTAATALPFGKQIVVGASESSSDYYSLSGDLSNGLVGYWSFNENVLNSIGTDDFEDKVGPNNGNEFGGVSPGAQGVIGSAISLDGDDDVIELASSDLISGDSSFSASCWMRTHSGVDSFDNNIGGRCLSIMRTNIGAYSSKVGFGLYGDGSDSVMVFTDGASTIIKTSAGVLDSEWHNIAVTYDSTTNDLTLFIDGINVGTSNGTIVDAGNENIRVGTLNDNVGADGGHFLGEIDEVAIWNRAISSTEVLELYRRGANRVRYQVKSCVDSSCNCKSFNTAPVGNANDCDGDGILNSADNDDPYKAEFVGPGGNGATAFSELFNRDSGNMAFTCNANTTDSDNDICVDDEITLSGDSKASSPSFSFFDFPSSSRPLDNRYFQYRVLMEAEENTACGGEPCLPELTSVEIGPSGRYFSGSPSVVNKTSEFLDKSLESLKVTNSSGCNMSYQISNDGNNFYYWDGASWVTGSDVFSEANDLVTINNNIMSFSEQLGSGDFFFRSYFGNSNFSECELDELQVIKSSQ